MTTLEVANAVDADGFTKGFLTADRKFRTVENAINATPDEPLMDALRTSQWEHFWNKRGSNPIQRVIPEYAD